MRLNNAINLDAYFNMDHIVWEKDLPYIQKINTYIEQSGFPLDEAPASERSFELVGDEKWIFPGWWGALSLCVTHFREIQMNLPVGV